MASNIRVTNRRTGETYPYVVSWRLDSSYFTAADGFEVVLLGVAPSSIWMEPLLIELETGSGDFRPMVYGRADRVSAGDPSGAITVNGRDYIGDLTETHLDPKFSIAEGEAPDDVLLRALKPMGIKEIVGPEGAWFNRKLKTTGVYTKKPRARKATFKADDPLFSELKPQKGVGLWEFCERFATRFGYTLQPTDDPTVLSLSRPDYEAAAIYDLRRTRDKDARNNIVSATSTRDGTAIPTMLQYGAKRGAFGKNVEGIGQALDVVKATAGINKSLQQELEGKWSTTPTGDGLKLYRYRYQEDNESKTVDQLKFLTQRRLGQFLKEGLIYQARVQGIVDQRYNTLWTPDTIANVYDELAGVYEPMWVETVSMSWDTKEGVTTDLTLWRLGAAVVGDPPPDPYVPQPKPKAEEEDIARHYNPLFNQSREATRDYQYFRPEAESQLNYEQGTVYDLQMRNRTL